MNDAQLSLFSAADGRGTYRVSGSVPMLEMSGEALSEWKQRIATFQHRVKQEGVPQQVSLFDAAPSISEVDALDPFTLPQQNTEFWRWRYGEEGTAALYFVIDYELPVLLYVGETVKSNQRWKGEHDCKRYLLHYRQAHYHHQLESTLGIAFWRSAPVQTRQRQRLESELIRKWRSPFNKENWAFWGTPFVAKVQDRSGS